MPSAIRLSVDPAEVVGHTMVKEEGSLEPSKTPTGDACGATFSEP